MNGVPNLPQPYNDPILGYAPGSPERATLKAALATVSYTHLTLPTNREV